MATPTLIATPGSASANSYCTVAEADAYHDSRLFATSWSGASTADKTVSLIWATRLLDEKYRWAAMVVDGVQALRWPRWAVMDAANYDYIPSTEIPQELKNATAELARGLIVADRTLDSDIEVNGLKRLKAGAVELEFHKGMASARAIPDSVSSFIPSWWGELMQGTGFTHQLLRA